MDILVNIDTYTPSNHTYNGVILYMLLTPQLKAEHIHSMHTINTGEYFGIELIMGTPERRDFCDDVACVEYGTTFEDKYGMCGFCGESIKSSNIYEVLHDISRNINHSYIQGFTFSICDECKPLIDTIEDFKLKGRINAI